MAKKPIMSKKDFIIGFFQYEKEQSKVIRGGREYYDVKGSHKYFDLGELFDFYCQKIRPDCLYAIWEA